MTGLRIVSLAVGAAGVALSLPFVVAPARAAAWIGRIPRSQALARLLTAADIAWVTWLLFRTPLGRFDGLKFLLWVLAPLGFVLVILTMEELLAPRAFGGLLLLVAAPVMDTVRYAESPFRFVLIVLAYVWVVMGMILLMSPYRFRMTAQWIGARGAWRTAGAAGLAIGALILAVGLLS